MRTQQQGEMNQLMEKLPILEKLDLLVQSTKNVQSLLIAAEKSAIISSLEKDSILKKFATTEDQLSAFYLLVNAKPCPATKFLSVLDSSGNESVSFVFEEQKKEEDDGNTEYVEEWNRLQKLIADNIDRLSSHTMNLGLVLCFSSGIGLISGKDREIIANCSSLEIDQLKKFYVTVSHKKTDAYDKLLKVLKMTNNNWALDVLHITD